MKSGGRVAPNGRCSPLRRAASPVVGCASTLRFLMVFARDLYRYAGLLDRRLRICRGAAKLQMC